MEPPPDASTKKRKAEPMTDCPLCGTEHPYRPKEPASQSKQDGVPDPKSRGKDESSKPSSIQWADGTELRSDRPFFDDTYKYAEWLNSKHNSQPPFASEPSFPAFPHGSKAEDKAAQSSHGNGNTPKQTDQQPSLSSSDPLSTYQDWLNGIPFLPPYSFDDLSSRKRAPRFSTPRSTYSSSQHHSNPSPDPALRNHQALTTLRLYFTSQLPSSLQQALDLEQRTYGPLTAHTGPLSLSISNAMFLFWDHEHRPNKTGQSHGSTSEKSLPNIQRERGLLVDTEVNRARFYQFLTDLAAGMEREGDLKAVGAMCRDGCGEQALAWCCLKARKGMRAREKAKQKDAEKQKVDSGRKEQGKERDLAEMVREWKRNGNFGEWEMKVQGREGEKEMRAWWVKRNCVVG